MSTRDEEARQVAPIAIVGMACRLPGNVSTLDDFWTMVSRSRDAWSPVPKERFSSDAFYHPNPQKGGCFNQRGGYFLQHDYSKFDAPFFQMTRQEAIAMDPQQRQLLECTYEALENAGLSKMSVSSGKMGVFVGGRSPDYRMGNLRDLNQVPMFDATGNHQSMQAAWLSYYFDLHGPCLTVDTACSSSVSALHLAVQSIRSDEADAAVVAGCNLNLEPAEFVSMSMLGIFNDDGRTYSFDHRAKSGFARGEGVGCLILKPLEHAIRDNDHIYSVIVNTGVNQDGRTTGITNPSGDAQEKLIREVYTRAGISTEDTGFVEAHGTGTKVGDPIEAGVLSRVFSPGRTKRFPLYVGSAKSNFGHLENTSGIVSIIKASLMLEKGFILPNANFEKANDAIPFDKYHLKVPTTIRPWPKNKRFISINNFGFGGSNTHVVLERFRPPSDTETSFIEASPRLFVLSANDEAAAKSMMTKLSVYIEQHPEVFQKRLAYDLAYTLGQRRTHFQWRVAIAASGCNELGAALHGVDVRPNRAVKSPKIAFVYTGQGAQWARMGQELMSSHPVFANTMNAAAACLEKFGADFPLIGELSKGGSESNINQPHISQPVCTAIQLALTDLLSSWGVKPSAVTGHSSGEIAAAYSAGAISLQDAMAVAYYRGHIARKIKLEHPEIIGGMLAVGKGPLEVKAIIKSAGLSGIDVACENSPHSVTVSGDESALNDLSAILESKSIFNRKLRVDIAYHSSHMQLGADEYGKIIRHISPKLTDGIDFYSSLLGQKLDTGLALNASYWVENLTKPVLFSSALETLYAESKPDLVVEIGPHSALEGPIKQTFKGIGQEAASEVKYLPSLVRNQNATITALSLAGNLFTNGQALDFGAVNQTDDQAVKPVVLTDLSPYAWSHQKYWHETRISKQHRLKPFGRHDLLGTLEDTYSEAAPTWRNVISTDDLPWLRGHKMQSLTTFPLAGYISIAIEAASQRIQLRGVSADQIAGFRLREVQASKALILDDGPPYETLVALKAYSEGTRTYSKDWDEFTISSWTSGRGWLEHCRGLISVKKVQSANPVKAAQLQGVIGRREHASRLIDSDLSLDRFYEELHSHGAGYSSHFTIRPGSILKARGEYSTCNVTVPETASAMPYSYETPSKVSTPFMDIFFQLVFPILGAGRGELQSLYMPSSVKEAEISCSLPSQPGDQVQVVAHGCPDFSNPGPVDFNLEAWHDTQTEPVVKISGFRMTPVYSDNEDSQGVRSLCYSYDWVPLEKLQANGAGQNGNHTNGDKALGNGQSDGSTINGTLCVHGNHVPSTPSTLDTDLILVTDRNDKNPLVSALSNLIELRTGYKPRVSPFSHVQISPSAQYIFLAELDAPILHNATAEVFDRLKKLLTTCSSVLWVTSGAYHFAEHPECNISQGFLRTIRSESSKSAATLDLDPNSQLGDSDRAKLILQAIESSSSLPEDGTPVDYEFAEEDGHLVVPRVVEREDINLSHHRATQSTTPYPQDFNQPGRRLKVAVGTYGSLDSIYWKDEPEQPLTNDEIEIKVAFTGMNFKDVVIAMGQVASPYLGVECSGTVSRVGSQVNTLKVGDRVCAMSLGAYGTYARCPATSAAIIPNDMTFDVAASIPVVYSTAYYGIVELARLQPGETILIHAAAGGVGQAAIQLAQDIGAEIFATVGSLEKKQFLMETYGISENHIFYSRDTAFGPALREVTGGRGVDVVINSLAGDILRESWESLAEFGRFIEIGKKDITSNTGLEMSKFEQNCTFSSVDLTLVAAKRPKIMGRVLSAVMRLLDDKTVKPITPISIVGISEVEVALRNLQSGRTSGKVVVNHLVDEQVKATHPTTYSFLDGNVTYLIIGGTGGIGRSMARRMVERGARHIVLLSRSGRMNSQLEKLIVESQTAGASIYVMPCDVGDQTAVTSLVTYLQATLPPIRGLVHAAMVLKDVLFEQMSFEDYQSVLRSKVSGAYNFHQALLDTPLDFFVMLSSVAGIVGNRGQAAYAGANTYLDALARFRRRKGLAASSLDLTAVEDVGYLAENASRQAQVAKNISGSAMNEADVLALVESAMAGKLGTDQCITGLHFEDASSLPYYASDGKFSHLRDAALARSAAADASGSCSSAELPIAVQLQRASLTEEARELVATGVRHKLAGILMISPEDVKAQPATRSISDIGLDSLNAIELRNWISKEIHAHLQVLELLTSGSVDDLAALILRKTSLKGVWSEEK
ncbi:hypothetical protein ATEG_07067 [Aspergillus terreus NIH2624]|uniref:Uncharacterized protein n=1 Tax=Aspergillus terreus (strain NIH 2624 / FGSC A1156) TaxID=341663 RepID=Q0CGX5_ASPTN|nr:uncharacterized protein ATEG_07067 [Aspergillus terreus NIH2624]EAU32451.1 hypothetical protein ATEG_07067 [Aspergillus terreus NIH2624]